MIQAFRIPSILGAYVDPQVDPQVDPDIAICARLREKVFALSHNIFSSTIVSYSKIKLKESLSSDCIHSLAVSYGRDG